MLADAEEAIAIAAACGFGGGRAESLTKPIVSGTQGVWRVHGGNQPVVVKILQPVVADGPWGADLDPESPFYWRREADFYESSLPGTLADTLRPPQPLGILERTDGCVGLCLEDLGPNTPDAWSTDMFRYVATASGRMIGVGRRNATSPSVRWLSRNWLHAYVARHADEGWRIERSDLTHELGGMLAVDIWSDLVALWRDRHLLLAWLDALPPAICHLDLSIKNVFAAANSPRAIDWAYVGWGPPGADIGGFALESALAFRLPIDRLVQTTTLMHEEYALAFHESDASVPGLDVQLGLHASAAVKFAWILPAILWGLAERPTKFNGRPTAEGIDVWVACLPHLVGLARRAREIAVSLDMV